MEHDVRSSLRPRTGYHEQNDAHALIPQLASTSLSSVCLFLVRLGVERARRRAPLWAVSLRGGGAPRAHPHRPRVTTQYSVDV
jgi:hypothetical protein